MPVHSHYTPERLKPEWIGEAGQQRRYAIMMDHALSDGGAEQSHPVG